MGNTAASLVQVQIMTNTSTRVEVPTVQDTQIQNTINTSTRVEISIVEQIQSKKNHQQEQKYQAEEKIQIKTNTSTRVKVTSSATTPALGWARDI